MKKLVSFICLLTIVLLSGCTQEEMLENEPTTSESKVFTSSFENNESRMYLENGLLSRWTAGDRISLFDGNTLNREYQFDGETGDTGGTFSMVNNKYGTEVELKTNYAVYPYAEDVKISESGVITTTLPSQQHYAENSYGLGDNTMVAVTHNIYDTFLKFKNVGSCIKLQLYGDDVTVKSITLTGNNGEKIAGKANITAAYDKAPVVSMADDATTSITLDCGEGVKIGATQEGATTFWITLPPVTFEKGITVTVTDVNDNVFTQTTDKKLTIERNVVKPMATVEVETQSDEIPYVTFDSEKVQSLKLIYNIMFKNTLEYSVNNNEWKKLGSTYISFGGKYGNIKLRGKNLEGTKDSKLVFENKNNYVTCTGDIRTLLDYENYNIVNTESARFDYLFENASCLISAPELPATELAEYCYYNMFAGCTNLVKAPKLPATNLAKACYEGMFYKCSSLTLAPELPATALAEYCYYNMFEGCTSLTQTPELPATTLASGCYGSMFEGCTSLIQTPELPATTLASGCYGSMFKSCTSLTQAPKLPAAILEESCYGSMFEGCTSLIQAPQLPAVTLAEYCYYNMFSSCTNLTQAPDLPATTLAKYCYKVMFMDCKSLTKAPTLPATNLAQYCYHGMFTRCTSLTQAPNLPATEIEYGCYSGMFSGCSDLTQAPALPAKRVGRYSYQCMFEECTSLTQAPELPATSLSYYSYHGMFKGCINLTQAPVLPAETLMDCCYMEMFKGCTKLNSITMLATKIYESAKSLISWVDGVAPTGTFIKAPSINSLPEGSDGIPSGWTVKNYGE